MPCRTDAPPEKREKFPRYLANNIQVHFVRKNLFSVVECNLYGSAWIAFVVFKLESLRLLSQSFILILQLYNNAIADHSGNERG
jgi:hypothetical protein